MATPLARIAIIVLLLQAAVAHGVQLALVPSSASFSQGDFFQVDVTISGLGDFSAPSVGAFDITIGFDETLLDSTGVGFCVGLFCPLGDPQLLEALTDVQLSFGQVNLAEVSLLSPDALDALQPSTFVLAQLGFFANAAGTSRFTLISARVDDAFGDKLNIREPGSAILLVGSLGVLAVSLRTRLDRRRAGVVPISRRVRDHAARAGPTDVTQGNGCAA